jgi:serine/threonine protein kinase/Tfp pilus assembly protein PilF
MDTCGNEIKPMTAQEWARIKDIFEAALNLPTEERQNYLQLSCGDDPDVYRTLVELVRNHQSMLEASRRIRTGIAPVLTCGELVGGRFRILRFIAAGGMGEVYEASDEQLKVRLALKTLRPALLAEAGALDRFRREILIARSVSHENLCRVFDFIEHRPPGNAGSSPLPIPCLTMELLEGESLAELIRRERPLSVLDAQPLIKQIAEGLQILHQHGVVHRDLKPSNVMLTRRKNGIMRAVVMDFGLAKRDDAEGDQYDSQTDLQAGAPYFMAPELLRNEKPSIASDIYSFGLVIDELVTRSRAFSADSLGALYYTKLWEQPADPATRADGLPRNCAQVIVRCLESVIKARFQSATEVVHALESDAGASRTLLPKLQEVQNSSAPRLMSRRTLVLGAFTLPVLTGAGALLAMTFEQLETTIEVFNIDNLTTRKEYDYFCKGITGELMRSLLHLPGVRVLPVYASRPDASLKRLGRFSLDGNLEVESGRIRLSMRLTDNRDGTLVWSENYDRQPVSNPIELESEIAHEAVTALEHRLLANGPNPSSRGLLAQVAMPLRRIFSAQSTSALPGPPTYSNTAFDCYMRGHSLLEEMSAASATTAIDYFKRAIQEDPNFALAYAALADAEISSMNYDVTSRAETLASARSDAEQAVRGDPTLAEAHMVLGAVRQLDWDWHGAESSFTEAMRLKPNLARARRWYGGLILQFRRFDDAIEQTKQALALDPYDRSGPPALGMVLTLAREFSAAEAVLTQALSVKDMVGTRLNLALLDIWLGHINSGPKSKTYYANALDNIHAAVAMERAYPRNVAQYALTDAMLALSYTMMGIPAAAQPYLEKSEGKVAEGTLSPVVVAMVYGARGDAHEAIYLLNRAASWHDRRLMYVNISPFFDGLKEEPGFKDLLGRMKLA